MNDKTSPNSVTLPSKLAAASDESPNAIPEEVAANIDNEKQKQDKKHDKPFARAMFHLTNFLGLHVIFNSTVSLFIAYNLLPTKAAKSAMTTMANIATPINAAWMKYVSNPIRKMIQGPAFKELAKEEMAAKIAHSARSRVETAFMCIAGFLALYPVKYLEDHRAQFLNFFDNLVHPGRTQAEKDAVALKPEDEPKETWGNLIRARFVGLGVVFGVDALQQQFNNSLGYNKGNIDTNVWKWGAKTSDEMSKTSPGLRTWLVNFFSRKNITLSGIQTDINPVNDMRGHLLRNIEAPKEMITASHEMTKLQDKIMKSTDKGLISRLSEEVTKINETLLKKPGIKPHMERAIFAEQSRLLLTKEIFLTLVVSATIYTAAKAPFMARLFEKIGLKKKEEPATKASDNKPQKADAAPVTEEALKETKHAETVKPRKKAAVAPKEKPDAFAGKHSAKTDENWQASVDKIEKENPNISHMI
jgi:hypothetical protein